MQISRTQVLVVLWMAGLMILHRPALAGQLVAADDLFPIPSSGYLLVEPLGVLENDRLDGDTAGITATLVSPPMHGQLSCPSNGSATLCSDGSFDYIPDETFTGVDRFSYQAHGTAGETASATVTLEACTTDAASGVVSCWQEQAYRDRLAALGLNVFAESFEGSTWQPARTVTGTPAVSSGFINWTTNFPGSNNLYSGSGFARSGQWAVWDIAHGLAQNTDPTQCDIDNPPDSCKPFDGLRGQASGLQLRSVGIYVSSVTTGSNIAVIIDGASTHLLGKLPSPAFRFFGLISPTPFSEFEFRELDGKTGQELPVYFDDALFSTESVLPDNSPPLLDPVGDRNADEGTAIIIDLNATDPDDGDVLSFTVSALPSGATFEDLGTGQARFSWYPGYDQAGSYSLQFTVSDSAVPAASDSETIVLTVNDRNRAPHLSPIGNRTVTAGSNFLLNLSATDADGNNLSFSIGTGAPGQLTDHGDGTAEFVWTPSVADQGNHSIVFTVTDDGTPQASDSETVLVTVTVPDVTPPVITLLGANPVELALGATFMDPGATASDDVDGDLTANIIVSGTVDASMAGDYLIDYRVSDQAGNTASVTRTVTVLGDNMPPIVNAPAPITVSAVDSNGTPATSVAISGFLGQATANDAVDGALPVSHDAPTQFPLGVTVVTFSASDSAGNTGSAQSSITVEDQDPPQIRLNGGGSLTVNVGAVFSDPGATATDNVDGTVTVSSSGSVDTATPGLYTLVYSASDSAGNTASVTRSVTVQTVLPRLEFAPDQWAEAGAEVRVRVFLVGGRAGGSSLEYRILNPLTQEVVLGGTRLDFTAFSREMEIVQVVPQTVSGGELWFEMRSAHGAMMGLRRIHKVFLTDGNVRPRPGIRVSQGSGLTRLLVRGGGPVTVEARVEDANVGDGHVYDWSATDNVLLPPVVSTKSWQLDPENLQPGVYKLAVKVSDDGDPALDAATDLYVRVIDKAPSLSTADDSDGDGLDDQSEGYRDEDGDGIPEYLDAEEAPYRLQEHVHDPQRLETVPGLSLRLGVLSFVADAQGARMTPQEAQGAWEQRNGRLPEDTENAAAGDLYDFEVSGLSRGGSSILVTIELDQPIPQGALYRKLTGSGWKVFVSDERNDLSSANRTGDRCPSPGSVEYLSGLREGNECIQLRIEDGGPNDEDGVINARVRDPGGLAVPRTKGGASPGAGGSSSGGGFTEGWLLLLMGLWFVIRSGFRRFRSRDAVPD